MLTHAPLPRWRDLARALLQPSLSPVDLVKPWHRDGEIAGLLSRSAWSLALIAIWRQKLYSEGGPPRVWIPDFFCNASLDPLRHTGASLIFYPISESLQPDLTGCRGLVQKYGPPDLFVFVHYFGQPVPAAPARDFCLHHGSWLVEDAVHVLRLISGVGEYGDFVLYSPHKLLPIPDGAVLVARASGPGKLGNEGLKALGAPEKWSDQLNSLAESMPRKPRGLISSSVLWLTKRLLQKLGIGTVVRPGKFTESRAAINRTIPIMPQPEMSNMARRLLVPLIANLSSMAYQRHRHQLLWDEILLKVYRWDKTLDIASRATDRSWTPYLAAYQAEEMSIHKLFTILQGSGIPVTTWPDLPPEVIFNKDCHGNAWALRHRRFYLPVHQSLGPGDFRRLLATKANAGVKTRDKLLELQWNVAGRDQWHIWMQEVGQSNMLQSWAYGEAKASAEGWRVHRGVFYQGSRPVAVVQMLEKRIGGLIRVLRINRGPLFLSDATNEHCQEALAELADFGSAWRGQILFFSPELPMSGPALRQFYRLGMRPMAVKGWSSVWVDLRKDITALRRQLKGKWRNMLVAAEKKGLEIEIGSSQTLFDWMLERYQEIMQEKGFMGIWPPTLVALYAQRGHDCPLIVIRAMYEGRPVGGIAIACHGIAATYLVGWNGPEGRRLKANQFILWQAISYLKLHGFHWFDLGGIDPDRTPGITKFKLGLGGQVYELVGEGWKI